MGMPDEQLGPADVTLVPCPKACPQPSQRRVPATCECWCGAKPVGTKPTPTSRRRLLPGAAIRR